MPEGDGTPLLSWLPLPRKNQPFPAWLRRRFPVLEAAHTNYLYMAFRDRRLHHKQSLFRTITGGGTQIPTTYLVLSFVLVFLTIVGFAFVGCCALILPAIAIPILQSRYARRANTIAYLPTRIGSVFSESGFFKSAALDVYLSGHDGRDVAEAIYLEKFERGLLVQFISWPVMMLLTFGVYFYVHPATHIHMYFTAGTAFVFFFVAYFFSLELNAGSISKVNLTKIYSFWSNSTAGMAFAQIGRSVLSGAVLLMLIVGVVFYYIGFGLFVESIQKSGSPSFQSFLTSLRPFWGYWATTALLLFFSLAMWGIEVFLLRPRARSVTWDFHRGVVPYMDFVQTAVLEDPVIAVPAWTPGMPPGSGPYPPLPPPLRPLG